MMARFAQRVWLRRQDARREALGLDRRTWCSAHPPPPVWVLALRARGQKIAWPLRGMR